MISLPPRVAVSLMIVRQPRAVVVGLVQAIAVGRLDEQHVGVVDRRRDRAAPGGRSGRDRRRRDDASCSPSVMRAYADPSRWPALRNSTSTPGTTGTGAVVADRLQLRQRAGRVGVGVERQRRMVLRVAVLVGIARVFFLDVRRIRAARASRDRACPACRRRGRETPARRAAAGSRSGRGARASARPRRSPWARREAAASCAAGAPSAPGTGRSRPAPVTAQVEQMLRAGDGAGGSEKRQ